MSNIEPELKPLRATFIRDYDAEDYFDDEDSKKNPTQADFVEWVEQRFEADINNSIEWLHPSEIYLVSEGHKVGSHLTEQLLF